MEIPSYLREKAKQCRRLAAGIPDQTDAIAVGLLALADEFEAKAVSQSAQEGGSKTKFGIVTGSRSS